MQPRKEGPDFVGVGVQKSGSTWLADLFAQHPGVLIAKKEIDFFVRYFRKGYGWYHTWFRNKDSRMAGDFTPNYIISPRPDPTHKESYPEMESTAQASFLAEETICSGTSLRPIIPEFGFCNFSESCGPGVVVLLVLEAEKRQARQAGSPL